MFHETVLERVVHTHARTHTHTQDDPEDLTFKKGDVMTVLRKDEDEWWFAKHEDGRTGSIPVPYVQIVSASVMSRCSCSTTGLWRKLAEML